ncbi:MAG: ABC transporter substrate-binding protein [Gammaproteobacteria bacterium]|nr:ABC transporter substrate-binding protein [Gammaproteobacteria bacterium]
MSTRIFRIAVAAILFLSPLAAVGQEAKPTRIGLLRMSPPPALNLAAFRQGMRDRGHIEGKTYVIVSGWRKPGGKREKPAVLARKLVARGVDLIVTVGTALTRAASRAAPSTPIVMALSADPVRAGLIKSLPAPGGNITGLSAAAVAFAAKSFEILKEMIPGLRHVATFYARRSPASSVRKFFREGEERAGRALGFETSTLLPKKGENISALFARAITAGVDVVYVRSTPSLTNAQHKRLVDAALKAGMPTMYPTKQLVKMGGLVSYGTNRADLYRRAATYVDKILKGAKPADLPAERPTKFDFVINLKTAKALGIKVPPAILLRATEVIE